MNSLKNVSKVVVAGLVVGAAVVAGELGAQAQGQPPLRAAPMPVQPSQTLSCAGVTAFRIEIERARDVKISSSKNLGAAAWTTSLSFTGKVATVDGRVRVCAANGAASPGAITADDPDGRAALSTCGLMAASLQAGQKLVLEYRGLEGARALANNKLEMTKPQVIACGVE